MVSQILKGSKHFTIEQAYDVAEYFAFDETEREYFILLIQKERAGNIRLQKYFEKKILSVKSDSLKIANRIKTEYHFSDHEKSIFYSNWLYNGLINDSGKAPERV